MKELLRSFMVLSIITFVSQCWAQEEQLSAVQILENVDDVINAPKDQSLNIQLVLIDKNGNEKTREMKMLQKGSDKRMVKFLSPAEQKGIAFLSLPDDIMYLYLPAFKKVRRIASHVKNTNFAGTDFTYEDMEAKRYSEKYDPNLLEKEDDHYILELNPKEGLETDYSKLIMWVRIDNFYSVKTEYYNKGGKLYKVMTSRDMEMKGNYWVSMEFEMEDLKEKHKTKMILQDVKFDSNLPDKYFTERYLEQ